MDEHEILAEFLNVSVDEIKEWSDGSFTVGNDDTRDYMVSECKIDYGRCLGKYKNHYIYKS
jgi:hypothetical protein